MCAVFSQHSVTCVVLYERIILVESVTGPTGDKVYMRVWDSHRVSVQINTWNVFDAAVPFGGYKMSGIGREHGEEVIHHYTQTKSVYQPLEEPQLWKM